MTFEHDGDEWQSTYVRIKGKGDWPFTEVSYVLHKKDLSNVDEPYLTAIKEARSRG